MAEAARAKRPWLTRDQAIGLGWGLTAVAACLIFTLFLRGRAEPSPWLRDSTEVLPANAVRWFTFALPLDGPVELSANAANGERFHLYVIARPVAGRSSAGGFQIIPEFTAENVSAHRFTGSLTRGEYHVMVVRTGGRESASVPATLRLQLRRAQARYIRGGRPRRFPGFSAPVARAFGSRFGARVFLFCGAIALLLGRPGLARASSEQPPQVRDTLVFKNGDRLQGIVIQKTAQEIVFKSDRFGEHRVPAGDAVVIPAEQPAKPKAPAAQAKAAVAPTPPAVAAAERSEAERLSRWDRFSLSVLSSNVRKFFGPWNGRVTFAADSAVDTAERDGTSAEATLRRKWERAELQFRGRYDYAETNQVPTTDTVRLSASWRRDFSKLYFAQYRPSSEWNRASKRNGVPNDYVLLQQEIGVGVQLLTKPARKVRAGLSQNRFDTWNSAPQPDHVSTGVQSIFEEIEFRLPWQVGVSQRGVWYPVADSRDGWENRVELNKKLTETLSLAFRYETRRHNPDGSAQDFNRMKLLLGFDF